jgi:hypothetical protein
MDAGARDPQQFLIKSPSATDAPKGIECSVIRRMEKQMALPDKFKLVLKASIFHLESLYWCGKSVSLFSINHFSKRMKM